MVNFKIYISVCWYTSAHAQYIIPKSKWRTRTAHLHVGFVVRANFLDPDVVLGVYEWLCSTVSLSDGHHTCNVLEVAHIVHLNLQWSKTYKYLIYLFK